jgi:hypothetical protein
MCLAESANVEPTSGRVQAPGVSWLKRAADLGHADAQMACAAGAYTRPLFQLNLSRF